MFKMLPAIQFDYETCFAAIKISYKAVNRTLTVKLHWIITQKIIPQSAFLSGHILAKLFRIGRKLGTVSCELCFLFVHRYTSFQPDLGVNPSVSATPSQPPFQGSPFVYPMLPYKLNMGRYTPSSNMTVTTARAMVMTGSMMDRRRSVAKFTSLVK